MSRARVLLDAALQLGEGERSGAAAVLAEAFATDPALLQQALAQAIPAGVDSPVRTATAIAGPWRGANWAWNRWDRLRNFAAARVTRTQDAEGIDHYTAQVFGSDAGRFATLRGARDACDQRLQEQGWLLG